MAEGAVFGQSDFVCDIAIGNPSTTDTAVTIEFVIDTGQSLTTSLSLPAGRRKTVHARDHLAPLSPTGDTLSFSTIVHSTNGVNIVADRSMYGRTLSNQGATPYYSGHARNGTPLKN